MRGVPVHASSDILNKLLRQELGFGGLVISDWEDVLKLSNGYRFVPNYKEGIKAAVNAGVDVAMIPHDAATYAKLLSELVGEGAVSKSRIDEAAGRMLRLKLEAGLFGPQKANPSLENLKTPELARRAALESMTLLENTKNVLPFKTGLKKLTVAGDSANSVERLLGGWSIGWQGLGVGGESVSGVSTVWETLRAQVPKTTQLAYAEDSSALKKEAASSDAVLLIMGEPPYAEGKGDVARPSLTPEQIGLFEAARASKKPVVVVLVAGRPLILPPQKPDALMMAYLPGSEGASAIVQALWGKSNPSGRLPFSYPRALEQLPMNYNRPSSVAYAPLYPFGAGLSYTTFGYGKLEVTQSGTKVKVSLEVKNTGVLEGAEVVQVFASHGGPQRQLATFARVFLQPGASQSVALEFPSSNLLTLSTDPAAKGMERKFVLSVGTQKVDLALEGP